MGLIHAALRPLPATANFRQKCLEPGPLSTAIKKQSFTEEQIIGVVREQQAGTEAADLCGMDEISEAIF